MGAFNLQSIDLERFVGLHQSDNYEVA